MIKLEDQIVKAHFEAKAAWNAGATEEEMKDALKAIRHAQWRWDYSAAGHGGHMHAPDIILKVIASGLDRAVEARTKLVIILTKHSIQQPIPADASFNQSGVADGMKRDRPRTLHRIGRGARVEGTVRFIDTIAKQNHS